MLFAILRTMRPHQWTKNLVLLAALVFSMNFLDTRLLVLSLEAVEPHAKHVEYEGAEYILTWTGNSAWCDMYYGDEEEDY